jgi:signal transduction histidine kinase
MSPKPKLVSMEESSLIRKFATLFMVMSFSPFLIIAYLFTQYHDSGVIAINQNVLFVLLFLSGIGALIGFWSMRKSILEIKQVAKEVLDIVKNMPTSEKIEVTENEIKQLTSAFREISKEIEANIKYLESSKNIRV